MKLTRLFIAAYAAFLALPAHVFAAPKSTEDQPLNLDEEVAKHADPTGGSSGGGSLVRTFVGLAVVIGVIYGIYWILRQVKASREERSSGSGLAALATLPLGPNRALHMVRAGHEVVILGVTDHGVTPIRTYDEDVAREAGLLPDPDGGVAVETELSLDEAAERAANGNGNGSAPAQTQPMQKPATVGEFFSRTVDEMRKRTRR